MYMAYTADTMQRDHQSIQTYPPFSMAELLPENYISLAAMSGDFGFIAGQGGSQSYAPPPSMGGGEGRGVCARRVHEAQPIKLQTPLLLL